MINKDNIDNIEIIDNIDNTDKEDYENNIINIIIDFIVRIIFINIKIHNNFNPIFTYCAVCINNYCRCYSFIFRNKKIITRVIPTVKDSLIVQFINKPCPFKLFGNSEQFNFVIKLVALSGNFN